MELTVDGRKVYAATGGKPFDPTLPAVVFIHGAAMDHTVWALQTRYFANRGFAVLALDLPGCGRSDGPMPDSVEALGEWLIRVLDTAGIKRADLVCHSMGGLIAIAAAAARPKRFGKLVLAGCAVPMAVNDTFLGAAKKNDHLAIDLMMDWAHGRSAHLGGCKVPGLWMVGDDTRLVERAKPGVLYQCLRICNDYEDGMAAAKKIKADSVVVVGTKDLMTPLGTARKLAATFGPDALRVIEDCGHMIMIERPDEFLAILREEIAPRAAA